MSFIDKRSSAASCSSILSVENLDSSGLNTSTSANNSSASSKKSFSPTTVSYKSYLCPGCSQHYDASRRGAGFVGKSPLILDCKHTVCEECVKKYVFHSKNTIVCNICQFVSQLPPINFRDSKLLQSVFPYNYYLMGLILCSKQQLEGAPISLSSTGMTLKKQKLGLELQEPTVNMIVDECCLIICKNPATIHCEECNDIYCNQCCTVVHKSGKSLWSHKMEPIVKKFCSIDLKKCSEHRSMDVDIYCKNCEIETCCYCFLEKHEGHERILLSKLNEAETLQLNVHKEKAKQVLKYLMATQKKIKYMNSYDTSFVETKISNYFADMHAQLYFLERKLREEAASSTFDNRGLNAIYSSVTHDIENMKELVNAIDATESKRMNLKNLLDKLLEVDTIPCHLITKDGDTDLIRFSVDPIIKDLESYFSVEKSEDNEYVLVSNNDLPKDYKPDYCFINDSESEYGSSKNLTSEFSDTQTKTPEASVLKSNHHKRKHSNSSNEQVFVTHINTTEEFYIQKKSTRWKFTQLSKEINQVVKHVGNVTQPALDGLYLVLYVLKNHREWCRCRIKDIISKPGQDTLYSALLIDYGNTIKVGIENLKSITPGLIKKQPFAVRCKLINPANAEWSNMAHIHMAQIISDKDTYMFVKNTHRDICSVNLMISTSDGNLTSVADLLILACDNTLIKENDEEVSKVEPLSTIKLFKNNKEFKVNDSINVIVTYIENPHKMFVQIAAYRKSYQQMLEELKNKFNKMKSCIPLKGSYVLVQHKTLASGNFHRAEVKEVNFNLKTAKVFLADIGISSTVSWSDIKILTEQFSRLECQAIAIKLAQINPPVNNLTWPDDVDLDFCTKYILTEEPLKMVVYKESPLEVALFEVYPSFDICLNAVFVEKGLATSTGIMSQTVQWQKVDAPKQEEDAAFMIEILKKQEVELSDEDDFNDNTMKQPVDVILAKNPHLIYIKFHMNKEKELKLNEELQVHYAKERFENNKWKQNDKCVVFDFKLNKFCRAIITSSLQSKFMVYLYDLGKEFVASPQNIFVYNKYFDKYHDMCFKCHLANLKPAGDKLKWSAIATEYLQNIFEENKNIFIRKVNDMFNFPCSLPVEMWYSTVIAGSALEPSQTQYKSINKLLLNSGLALRKSKPSPTKSIAENLNREGNLTNKKDTTGKKIKSSKKRPATTKNADEINENRHTIIGNEEEVVRLLKKDLTSDENKKTKMTNEEALTKAILKNLDVSSDEVFKNAPDDKECNNKSCDEKEAESSSLSSSEKKDWNDLILEEEEQENFVKDTQVVTDWLPPFKITKMEFDAVITTADYEGVLFLHDSEMHPLYESMQDKIKQCFDEFPKEVSSVKTDWKVGDLCMILYEENWYRGKVIEIKSKNLFNVFMIDYGSDHDCKPEEIVPNILLTDIPAFASKVKLHKVYCISGSWTKTDYEILLDNVTETARVVVKDNYFNEIPSVEVFTSDGKSLNEIVATASPNLARTRVTQIQSDEEIEDEIYLVEDFIKSESDLKLVKADEKPVPVDEEPATGVEKSDGDDESLTTYQVCPLQTYIGKKVPLTIVNVLRYDLVVLDLSSVSSSDTNQFLKMTQDIQECANKQVVIDEITVGVPCICPFSEDGIWYRAEVFNIDSLPLGYVLVFFVDYGNIDSVPYNCIREMKPCWFKIPVYHRFAKIDATVKDEKYVDAATKEIAKLQSTSKLVEFLNEEPLVIHLYEEDEINFCYQNLVEKNILVINKDKNV